MVNLKKWVNEKLLLPARSLTAFQIGLAVSVGLWGGIFPIPAMSTFSTLALCTILLSSLFNAAMTSLAIAVNVIVTPIQIMVMPLFMNLPSLVSSFGPCSVSELITSIQQKPILETCSTFGVCMTMAVIAWAALAVPAIFLIQFIVASLVRTAKRD
jgi:hypothetical protein